MADRIPDDAMKQLAKYCFRAQLMRRLVHFLDDENGPNLEKLDQEGWWEFETFLHYWLSALFVLVEAFNKLKIKDAAVQRLFKENVGELKLIRHETYHFTAQKPPGRMYQRGQLNWAEELHDAIYTHVTTIINRRAKVEKFLELRTKNKK